MRRSDPNQLLHNHVTRRISARQNERVRSVSLEAGADYRKMDEKLLTNAMRKALKKGRENINYRNKKLEGQYRRLSVDEPFKTLTTMRDQQSTKWMLHSYSRRLFSLRELARAMGFPDSFIWDLETTEVSDALKQIGNAVPVPFARALGNEVRKVLPERDTSGESGHNEDIVDPKYIATDDQADQNIDTIEEILAGSETDSDEEIDDLIIARLEREFNQSTDDQTDAESDDEQNLDTDKEVSGSDVDVDEDMKDQEDLVSAEKDMNENTDSEEEFLANIRMRREEIINTGGSRDDAIVIDDSE
ncbi:hypothetical protein BCON_0469g00090 [Botryotinia convoluta]|uniref:DNA (cytosine-5-)-methyltransferase n=1 Tax=Botryotinia convoluta TaxID=54673 RepID=A0A4Z1H6K8_9HELO|nr:hypothetical protein BCON_0469g00090 [Botryotinia convoluta]